MNKKVKLLATSALGTAIVLGSVTANASTGFTDVPTSDVNYQYILDLQSQGKVEGKGNNQFGPNDSLTRAEFVTMIEKAFNVPSVGNKLIPFKDANGWYQQAVTDAYYAKITNGTSATTFSPNLPLQRQEAATMIWNYLTAKGLIQANPNSTSFDSSDADSWAKLAVTNIMAYGFRSDHGSKYNSKTAMNRGDAAALIDLAMHQVNVTSPTSTVGNPTSNSSNLIQNSDGSTSLGNIKTMNQKVVSNDLSQTAMNLMKNVKMNFNGNTVTITLPDTGNGDIKWGLSSLGGTTNIDYFDSKGKTFSITFQSDALKKRVQITLEDYNTALVLAGMYLKGDSGTWIANNVFN